MTKVRFEWDPRKAARNWRIHGVSFEHAAVAISDVFAIDWLDESEDYDEDRFNILGMCKGVLLHVTYTERGERIRIISARKAERHETDDYFRENSPR
jgi:uncharacterized DUF497 family protein